MFTHPVLGKPPKPPTSKLPPGHSEEFRGSGSYVGRHHRLRRKDEQKTVSSDIHRMVQKTLPKISGDWDRSPVGAPGSQQPSEGPVTSVPGVQTRDNTDHKPLPSLPSLPSIPGSPSYPDDQAASPLMDRVGEDRDQAKVPVYPSKHRFEKNRCTQTFAWQNPGTHSTVPQTIPGHSDQGHGGHHRSTLSLHEGHGKSHTSASVRIRYSQVPAKMRVVSATQSEPAVEVSRKWKEDCGFLRCQMLRRQFQEGDEQYQLWGRYPCHHVDPSVMLDD
ncbi:hypothetical protein ACOMHN_048771 [Nucella lapillus]